VSAPFVLVDYSDNARARLSPARYADPNEPLWTFDSAGHESVPVPSSASVPEPKSAANHNHEKDKEEEESSADASRTFD
jgi:hypothetical protein